MPGRSILSKSNLWMDFAGLLELPSVVSAVQGYMGLYIFGYVQRQSLARRINREFTASEGRFSHLLEAGTRSEIEDVEFTTLAIILAMQDVSPRRPS